MLINQEIWRKVLQWNSFPILFNEKDVVCVFDVILTTKSLSITRISTEQEIRHKVISELHSQGLSDNEISNYLNLYNIRTPTGLNYYSILVWVTRNKLKKRENRKLSSSYKMSKLKFWLKPKTHT